MNSSYPYTFGFFSGVLSVFDMGGTLQEKNMTSITKGLSFDMQQLSDDQSILVSDYKKATAKAIQENFGDDFE